MSTPYDYYPAVLYAIGKVGEGFTVTSACAASNITVATFRSYCEKNEVLRDLMLEAEQRSFDALADALVTINTSEHGSSDPKMASVLSKNIQWVLAKRDPKRFGERITVQHDVRVDVTITSALNRGRERAAQIAPPVDAIETTFVDLTPAVPVRR